MSLAMLFATFFVTWWIVLFAILPWGVKTQAEAEAVVPGSAPSAPVKPLLLVKAGVTTAVSVIIAGAIYWAVTHSGLAIDAIPILSDLGRPRG